MRLCNTPPGPVREPNGTASFTRRHAEEVLTRCAEAEAPTGVQHELLITLPTRPVERVELMPFQNPGSHSSRCPFVPIKNEILERGNDEPEAGNTMKKKTIVLSITALLFILTLSACGEMQQEIESPVREATQQVEKARDVQQQIEDAQQQR